MVEWKKPGEKGWEYMFCAFIGFSEQTSETDGHNLGVKAQIQQCSGALLAHGYRHDNISQPS